MHSYFRLFIYGVGSLLLITTPAHAHEQHAHVHGAAKLNIAIEGRSLILALESPMESLLGFEHAPRNSQEQAAVDALKKQLSKPAQLFELPAKAECENTAIDLESPLFEHDIHQHDSHHADLDAEFAYECKQPGQLKRLSVQLFERFPHLHKIDVQIVAGQIQKITRLTPGQNQVAW
ncbi:DUF2796 domain-containing protein [Methylobacillus sp. Pita1]|uniref:DUF2796 domain-containing protein n=1 Tax=Methylobacillus sp. Pita1 TaxID=3382642 RepID=UPI0038B687D5